MCWPTAASTALCLTTLLRPSDQSLAVEHIKTSDQPRRQPYWYHPRVVRLSVIGHSQWLPHGPGMLYRNTFGTRLLFPSSAENGRSFCSGCHSLMWSDNVLCFIYAPVAQCWSVTMYWLLQTDFIVIVRWSCSSNAIMPPEWYSFLLLLLLCWEHALGLVTGVFSSWTMFLELLPVALRRDIISLPLLQRHLKTLLCKLVCLCFPKSGTVRPARDGRNLRKLGTSDVNWGSIETPAIIGNQKISKVTDRPKCG